jgi:hypothetical protein
MLYSLPEQPPEPPPPSEEKIQYSICKPENATHLYLPAATSSTLRYGKDLVVLLFHIFLFYIFCFSFFCLVLILFPLELLHWRIISTVLTVKTLFTMYIHLHRK